MEVIYENKKINVEKAQTVKEILKDEIASSNNKIMGCVCNNEIKSLDYKITKNTKIELLDLTTQEGRRIYVRGLMFILTKALKETYPDALLTINYQLSSAMYCEIDNMEITEEFIKKLDLSMRKIIEKDLSIKKVDMTIEEAEEFYKKEKTLRGIIQLDSKFSDKISLYYCEDFYNYFFGVMPVSTKIISIYEILKYDEGFLIRYPNKNNPSILANYKDNKKLLNALKDYEKLHKKLNINTVYKLNKEVEKDDGLNCILVDESLHEKRISDIADDIIKRGKVKVVLIAGPSSSGKTTFAQRLGLQLKVNGIKPVTLSVDNYFVEREQNPKDEFGNYDFECIEAIDLKLFNEHLLKLLSGEEIDMPTFDFEKGHKTYNGNKMKLKEDEILVIEGIHCLNDKLTDAISKENKYKIYVSDLAVLNMDYHNRISTTDARLIRRIVRDSKFRGYSALHTLKMWYSVNRGEEKNIFPYQEEADIMFNSSLIYELGVLKAFAMPLLEKIGKEEPEYKEAQRLSEILNCFKTIPEDKVPKNSLLREFIGGSIFNV